MLLNVSILESALSTSGIPNYKLARLILTKKFASLWVDFKLFRKMVFSKVEMFHSSCCLSGLGLILEGLLV